MSHPNFVKISPVVFFYIKLLTSKQTNADKNKTSLTEVEKKHAWFDLWKGGQNWEEILPNAERLAVFYPDPEA